MNKVVIALAFITLTLTALYGQSQRVVLLEEHTSTTCAPCAAANPGIDATLASLGIDKVVAIKYHMNWPAPGNDPWYFNNVSENTTRRTYYSVNSVPQVRIDGTQTSTGGFAPVVNSRYALPSPYDISMTSDLANHTVTVKVKATATPPAGNKYLRIGVLEKIYNTNSPFPNGETEIAYAMLDMLPDGLGTAIDLAVGDSVEYTLPYNTTLVNMHPPTSLSTLLAVVAFMQNDANKEVLQAAYHESGVNIGTNVAGALINNSQTATLSGFMENKSLSPIDLAIGINVNVPAGWNVTAQTEQGAAIPVNNGTATVTLDGMETLNYTITADPQGNPGGFSLQADVSLASDPNISESSTYSVSTNDVDILVVDDDGGATYESYFVEELNQMPYVYGVVSINSGDLAGADLGSIEVIFWNCANVEPTINDADRALLSQFLDNGGKLFLNGVDIAYELADPTSPYYNFTTLAFFNDYLHATYVKRQYTFLVVDGIPGDPITDGMATVGLYGGTGASTINFATNDFANQINPGDADAAPIFSFFNNPTDYAGIRAIHNGSGGQGRVVLTTFGFETLADENIRALFADRVVTWLKSTTGIEDDRLAGPATRFELKANYPNPFNPETHITYALPATAGDHQTTLVIYNQLGQKVRTLVNRTQSSGQYEVTWNGMDDAGNSVASGVYFYKLQYGPHQSVRKMLLLR